MKDRFTVLIVDYHSIENTLKYIKQLIDNTVEAEMLDFVIIDNAEYSTSLNELEKECAIVREQLLRYHGMQVAVKQFVFKHYKLYHLWSGTNLGYARGNNLGAKFSEQYLKNRYLVVSNNDLIISDKAFSWAYFEEIFIKYKECAVVGPVIVDPNGVKQSPRGYQGAWKYLFLTYWNILLCGIANKYLNFIIDCNKICKVYWVSGCFMVMDAEKFVECGMFDEKTFLFGEEMILSERLLKKGYCTIYTPEIELIHNHSVTIKRKYLKLQIERINFESVLYYFQEYRHINKAVSFLAKVNFGLFCVLYTVRKIPQRLYHIWTD